MGKISQSDINQALSKVMHPEINYSLVDLEMLDDIVLEQGRLNLVLKLPFLGVPIKDDLIQLVKKAITDLDKTIEAKISLQEMNPKERDEFTRKAKEGWKL